MILEEVSRKERKEIDITLLSAIAMLVSFGMAALYSSTFSSKNISFSTQAIVTMTIGTLALFIGMAIRTDFWRYIAKPLFVITVLLLILVLLKGTTINNAKRWLKIWHFKVQISEIAKVSIILLFATLLDEWETELSELKKFATLMGLLGITTILIALEPSISAAGIVFSVGLCMVFYAGAKIRHVITVIFMVLILFTTLIFTYPHARNRILTGAKRNEVYQVKQAKLAISNGEILGRGPGRGLAKYRYLPEISNDFIFALIAEEFGILGSFGTILFFIIITIKGFQIAKNHILSTYKTTLAMGITFLIVSQAALHIAINTGIIPPTGVVLPFVSYGKLAILVNMFLAGILLRLSYEASTEWG